MKVLFVAILGFFWCTSVASADGDTTMRPMNGAEKSTFTTLQASIQAALPKTPRNYTAVKSGFDTGEIPAYLTTNDMASMQFKALYTLNQGAAESGQRGALEDMMKGTPEQQARRAALTEKTEQLQKARKIARSQSEKDRIKAELKKIGSEESALDEQIMSTLQANLRMGFAGTAIPNITNAVPAKELTIRVIVNTAVEIYTAAQPYNLQGAPHAFAQDTFCPDAGTYCITALIGTFETNDTGGGVIHYTPQIKAPGVLTKVRGLAIIVSGPADKPESVQDLVKSMDLAKLTALVQ
jgi:hypothetical protein